MRQIKELFDPSRDIHRAIEKVITYSASQGTRLKAEISEYIVTDHIEEQFEKLLLRMREAMDNPGAVNEVGVWVAGFYGSGKSSFTKYLGLAIDGSAQVDGTPFLKHLQSRMSKPQTRALLATVAAKHPTAVVLLDLASEMLAGATMEEVSSVLYYKVLQWAGYSRNLKVAAFERRMQKDGRYAEFEAKIEKDVGTPWKDVQNDPLVVDSLVPAIAHEMYPKLFTTPTSFSTETADIIRFENERVKEMLDIVRETSGKEYILFIIDEVGQYVGSRQNLILNLDGLAKNLKHIGGGKAWIFGTAQQTLTEDNPRAALNSPELTRLKDRFPIHVDLEASDIKEICYRRLLAKSPNGETELGGRFDAKGQALRQNTKLQDAKYYDADLDRETFINLYPFLPAHFDILLHLLGTLAKSTGGIGLRSAIKVIQDVLVERRDDDAPAAEQPIGWLATTVTLYDALEKDIRRAFPSIHKAVGKALVGFRGSACHQGVAKTVAVLQILGNMPVTIANVAALMHDGVEAPSRKDEVEGAVKELIADPHVPFGEQDGSLKFFSEKLNDIEQERAKIPPRAAETRRIHNEALKAAFTPLPSTRLDGTLTVTSGLKAMSGSQVLSLAGEGHTIQTVVEWVDPTGYDAARTRLIDESRQRSSQHAIYLLGRSSKKIDDMVAEIYRCQQILERYRGDPDQEVKDYCTSQADSATNLAGELTGFLKASLAHGSFIFRGNPTAVDHFNEDVLLASKKHLDDAAKEAFDRYCEAPLRADTALAEKFLRLGNLKAVTAPVDPLNLVQISGGTPRVNVAHKALVSIRDYLKRQGTVEGKRLVDHFTDAPFGWSPDTLRYLVAALLVAGEIKLKVSGREVTVNGQQAIEALRTNNAFKAIGISLREDRPSMDVLARAAERLTDLIGDTVVPLEDEISKLAMKHLAQRQHRLAPLAEKLERLGVAGAETIRTVTQEVADLLLCDASDAPQRLGGEASSLYEALKWAGQVETALKQGLEAVIGEIQTHRHEIEELPASGIPGKLRQDVDDALSPLVGRFAQRDFFKHAADFSTALTALESRVRDAAREMAEAQRETIKDAQQDVRRLPEWSELNQEEQSQSLEQLDNLAIVATPDLAGLKQLLAQEYVIATSANALKKRIEQLGRQRQQDRLQEELAKAKKTGQTKVERTVHFPVTVTSFAQLQALIDQLQTLKNELAGHPDIEVTITIEE